MMTVWLLGIAHGLSDAAAGLAVGWLMQNGSADAGLLIFLYNGLAFGLQPVSGLLLDVWKKHRMGIALGLALTSIGLVSFQFDARPGMLLIGLGSALFHACGGAISIMLSPNKASGPGVFSAFGVIGLVTGVQLSPLYGSFLIPALGVSTAALSIAGIVLRVPAGGSSGKSKLSSGYEVSILIIVIAFALRSLVWSSVDLAPEETVLQAILIGISAGLGKLIGGFLSDKMGWLNWMIVALIGSALSLTLASGQTLLMIGVFLLQSVTGLTIAWLGRVLPDSPAFAASLALGAAVIIGGLPFVFTDATWFGDTILLSALSLSMLGYLVALRGNKEEPQTNN